MKQEYAIYKGDKFLCAGTAKECAEYLGVQKAYIHWLVTPAAERRLAKRKNPQKCTIGVKI